MIGRTYYFLHIPKTAGVSVGSWLKSHGDLHICPDVVWSQLLRRDRATLDHFNMFAGHFYGGLADYLSRDLTTFTFLRHPVDRSLSHYLHIMRDERHYLHQRARRLGSFTAFMQDAQTMPMLYNFQTRALSMEFDVSALQKNFVNADNTPFALERHIESALDGYESAVNLPRAMARLDSCSFVGITERLEESLGELQRVLGEGGRTSPTPVLNTATNKPDLNHLSRDEHDRLIELLSDDMALYEYAKSLCRWLR
jgi:Sulfotransferase family